MSIINIQTMTPKALMRKEAFKRAIPSDQISQGGIIHKTGGSGADAPADSWDNLRYELMTQSDFMREYDVNAHNINSVKYYHNPITKDSEGKIYQKIKSRTAISFQERIFTQRLTTLTANNVSLRTSNAEANEETTKSLLAFREGWEVKNVEIALFEAISSDGKTGDCAINFFLDNAKVGWRTFSFEKGDTLYPHYDPMTGKLAVFARKYATRDEEDKIIYKLDVWDDRYYGRYTLDDASGKQEWKVEQAAIEHNFPRIPIAYDRYGEPFWANSQSLIDAYELAVSQFCENNMAYALRILYAFGAEMDMQSNLDGTPTQINSVSTDAKVGFLEPADASASFELQLKTLEKNILKCSFVVDSPEIKSGADMSSLTVKMLYSDAYTKAMQDSMHFQPFLDDVVDLFKYGYGVEKKMTSKFASLYVKGEMMPYIFMSEQEIVTNCIQGVTTRSLSRRAANKQFYELGYCELNDYQQIEQEAHDELVGEAVKGDIATTGENVINQAREAAAQ